TAWNRGLLESISTDSRPSYRYTLYRYTQISLQAVIGMAKIGVGFKLEAHKLDELKDMAKENDQTLTEAIEASIFQAHETQRLKKQIATLEDTVTDLRKKYEAATGRKPATTKRITIPVTDVEYKAVKDAAHHADMPMTQVMRQILESQIRKQGALEFKAKR
ncbi:MAG: hypothetical protein OXU36_19215, partial [Candidatus Poribacteria bacterium]|nr:hypothetical protein [Candidatus Poribacteria bacterium]